MTQQQSVKCELGPNKPVVAIFRRDKLPRSETFIRQQVLALKRWSPIFVYERLIEGGLTVDEIPTRCIRDDTQPFRDFMFKARRRLGWPHAHVKRFLLEHDVQLVHAHFGVDAVDIWPTVRACDLPLLVTLHGYDINIHKDWWWAGLGGARHKHYPEQLLVMAHHPTVRFIAVSDAIRQRAIEFGIPKERIDVRYIGIDTAAFCSSRAVLDVQSRQIAFVGRLVENKGVEPLIRAFSFVHGAVPRARLSIIGDGPLRGHLTQLAQSLHLPIEFKGQLDQAGVTAELRASRLLCQPSITIANGASEGFGMVILEAQACGIPVVSSARGGSTEGIEDGVTGFRFPEGDVETLAQLLTRLLLDDALAARMSIEARNHVERRFTLGHCTRALEATYSEHAGLP